MAAAVDSDKVINKFTLNNGSEPAEGNDLKTEEAKTEAEPPDALPLEREVNSDTETIVEEKETVEMCKEMKECLNSDSLPEEFHVQPLWKADQLPAAPTPVARPVPVFNADPDNAKFSTVHHDPPKPVIIADPPHPVEKSKAKLAAAAAEEAKLDGAKIVTLRNPMFHSNLPPVQITNQPVQKKQEQIRISDPILMPPKACQATIRNPLMTMMHQKSLIGVRTQSPQINPMYGQQYNYVNLDQYNPVPPNPPTQYMEQATATPKPDDFQTSIMNLPSFTQKNDEGYYLSKTPEDYQQRSFLTPADYYENQSPKSIVSSNPIGTRPVDTSRSFESDSSLFVNLIQGPKPIGTPLKQEECVDYTALYTPFGQEDTNVFRNAFLNAMNESSHLKNVELGVSHVANGNSLPKLNSEVSIHHVTESKFYKSQEPGLPLEGGIQGSLFSRPPPGHAWPDQLYGPPCSNKTGIQSARSSPTQSGCSPRGADADEPSSIEQLGRFGPVGARACSLQPHREYNVFLPDSSITDLSSLEVSEREIESFKRFEFYFKPPQQKPKVQLDFRYIAAVLSQNHKYLQVICGFDKPNATILSQLCTEASTSSYPNLSYFFDSFSTTYTIKE